MGATPHNPPPPTAHGAHARAPPWACMRVVGVHAGQQHTPARVRVGTMRTIVFVFSHHLLGKHRRPRVLQVRHAAAAVVAATVDLRHVLQRRRAIGVVGTHHRGGRRAHSLRTWWSGVGATPKRRASGSSRGGHETQAAGRASGRVWRPRGFTTPRGRSTPNHSNGRSTKHGQCSGVCVESAPCRQKISRGQSSDHACAHPSSAREETSAHNTPRHARSFTPPYRQLHWCDCSPVTVRAP